MDNGTKMGPGSPKQSLMIQGEKWDPKISPSTPGWTMAPQKCLATQNGSRHPKMGLSTLGLATTLQNGSWCPGPRMDSGTQKCVLVPQNSQWQPNMSPGTPKQILMPQDGQRHAKMCPGTPEGHWHPKMGSGTPGWTVVPQNGTLAHQYGQWDP